MFLVHSWIIPETTPEVCLENLIEAVAKLSETEKMHINKVGSYPKVGGGGGRLNRGLSYIIVQEVKMISISLIQKIYFYLNY